MSEKASESNSAKPVRKWPAFIILLLVFGIVAFTWMTGDAANRQAQVMRTIFVSVIGLILLMLWLLFLSRLPWRRRLAFFSAILALLAIFFTLFKISGVSGDLMPIFEYRWADNSSSLVAELPVQEDILGDRTDHYPQFLGPDRSATIGGVTLAANWAEQPPKRLWQREVGQGWSAFAIYGHAAITQEQHGHLEMVVNYDLTSGKIRWAHEDETAFSKVRPDKVVISGEGPRATPTIFEDRVYTMGATGVLNCLNLITGKKIWGKNVFEEHGVKTPEWGMAGSPLLYDSLVVVSAGGEGSSLVAYHKDSGEKIWSAGNDPVGYSAPRLTKVAGQLQVIIFNRKNIVAHHPYTGEIFWQHPWPKSTQYVAIPLTIPGDRVFVSSGYGTGCELLQIEHTPDAGWHVTSLWKTPRLKAKFTNVIYHDEYIYGLDDGVLVCLDITNGQRKWKKGRYGHGQVILIGDLLLVQSEKGYVALVEATPEKFNEIAKMDALTSKTWNNAAFANPYLLVRNDKEAICFELNLAAE